MENVINRQKIIISGLMLLATMVALTTASYAWFSVNSAITLSGLEINVNASEGIQVSVDAETWKASVDVADIIDPGANYATHTNQVPTTLAPVSTIGSQTAGNFEMFSGTLVEGGTTTLTTAALTDAAGTTGNYIAFDLFIKSSTTEDLYLMSPSALVYTPVDVDTTVGLEWATRVAFFNQGTDAASNATAARALASGTSADQVIWEPNALNHTTAALADPERAAVAGTKYTPYYGIKAAGTGITVVDSEQATDAGGLKVNFDSVSTITPDTDATPFENIAGNIILSITPGITKVRIYIWVEGQDIDCENSVSLGVGNIAATIKFQKV